jgi:hypothetical protein
VQRPASLGFGAAISRSLAKNHRYTQNPPIREREGEQTAQAWAISCLKQS